MQSSIQQYNKDKSYFSPLSYDANAIRCNMYEIRELLNMQTNDDGEEHYTLNDLKKACSNLFANKNMMQKFLFYMEDPECATPEHVIISNKTKKCLIHYICENADYIDCEQVLDFYMDHNYDLTCATSKGKTPMSILKKRFPDRVFRRLAEYKKHDIKDEKLSSRIKLIKKLAEEKNIMWFEAVCEIDEFQNKAPKVDPKKIPKKTPENFIAMGKDYFDEPEFANRVRHGRKIGEGWLMSKHFDDIELTVDAIILYDIANGYKTNKKDVNIEHGIWNLRNEITKRVLQNCENFRNYHNLAVDIAIDRFKDYPEVDTKYLQDSYITK